MLRKFLKNCILGRLGLYSFLLALPGIGLYTLSRVWFLQNYISPRVSSFAGYLILVTGFLFLLDIVVLRNWLVGREEMKNDTMSGKKVAVGMTAYNDEECITNAVSDFIKEPLVNSVTVVDNNSSDHTGEEAARAGAVVVVERKQGYGYACMRALEEASNCGDIIVLVEGDETFAAGDVRKLLPYLENCDMVIGTRTTRELNGPGSQMDWLMVLGNIFVAKLLQIRFWGIRFTDMGCTYRVMRKDAYEKIKYKLTVGKMHFLPHMLIQALQSELKVIEVPITFRKRAGKSKGVGNKKLTAIVVGIRMILLILFS